ncbi:Appr-1-p processing protein [Bacillus cereus]|uniref:macro domain-containing protein n=1 Tax=Bacillus paranthracis TaxID=2026186 RepID=UPI0007722E9B|nr:macro domain-containing protein [Bacillus paranthracis]KXI81391.1 Appr-1-p processing protein [Bacillus cereus]MCU5059464.1 macro domain-containing protein [Bacillus cereus]MDK7541372.1 macro domain-containing protein [Bacillus paranthracis]MDK7563499.1 macro domain-containing protein [Bacillus paranthracis]
MRIFIENGDITNYCDKVDVIVNAWNRNFIPGFLLIASGVSRTIFKKAGKSVYEEVRRKGPLKIGEAVITSSGFLDCKAIIHVAGINAFWKASEYSIRESTRNALQLLIKENYKSIAIPLIGSGSGGYKKEKRIAFIKEECEKFQKYSVNVFIVNYESDK